MGTQNRSKLSGLVLLAILGLGLTATGLIWTWGTRGGGQNRKTDEPLHILLVTLDTTRFDHMGYSGYLPEGLSPTPVLDAIVREEDALAYRYAFASTPLTLPSHATILSGLEPPQHGVRENEGFRLVGAADRDFPLLAETLRDAGYQTGAAISGQTISAIYGLNAGFDSFYDLNHRAAGGEVTLAERSADATTDLALEWVQGMSADPSFFWLHYFDAHHPHQAHQGYPGRVGAERSLYDGEIAFADEQLGRVIKAYKDKGIWDHTLVIVTADHGEGLKQHREESHGHLVFDSTMRVPLVIKLPKTYHGAGLNDQVARTIDIAPTILDMASCEVSPLSKGRSLLNTFEGPVESYGESMYPFRQFAWSAPRCFRRDTMKVIVASDQRQLFDLANDPQETQDLAEERPEEAARLERLMLDFLKRMPRGIRGDARAGRPASYSGLGYFSGSSMDVEEEPRADLNRRLPHPGSDAKRLVIETFDALMAAMEHLRVKPDLHTGFEPYTKVQGLVDLLLKRESSSPMVLFWAGRAKLKLASHAVAKDFGAEIQLLQLEQARKLFAQYLAVRKSDVRAANMRLTSYWLTADCEDRKVDQDRALNLLLDEGQVLISRQQADGITYAFVGLAWERKGLLTEALAAFEKACELSPEKQAFRRDKKRLQKKLGQLLNK